MSGDLKAIKARTNNHKRSKAQNLAKWRAEKKLKAMEDVNRSHSCCHLTPTSSSLTQSRTVCFSCGSKDGVEVSHLSTSHLTPVSQCIFGRDSMKDSDYQRVLGLLDVDVVHEFVSYIVNRELQSSRKILMTVNDVQHELNRMDMKQIIRRLVKQIINGLTCWRIYCCLYDEYSCHVFDKFP